MSNPQTDRADRPTPWQTYTILLLGSAAMLLPLFWMISTSLKTFDETLADPPTLLPRVAQWRNYIEALRTFEFGRYLGNSFIVTLGCIIGTILSASLSAYALVAFNVRARGWVLGLLLATVMLPSQVTVVPLFRLFIWFGWINTFKPLIVPSWFGTNVFAIFLLRQFFLTIPKEYIEAARMDGASELRILATIFLPLSKPALLTVTVFTFIGSWNDLWGPLLYIYDEKKYTLPIGLMHFLGASWQSQGTPWHWFMAISTVMMLPVIVVFFLAQRWFIEGISTAGIKG